MKKCKICNNPVGSNPCLYQNNILCLDCFKREKKQDKRYTKYSLKNGKI